MKNGYLLPVILIAAYSLSLAVYAAENARWYSDKQVSKGKDLFAQQCAACHSVNAEGTKDWKQRDADGNLPPPPLNGTAHAWHHPLDVLRRTIREGGTKFGGTMPPFADKLGAEDIDALIAYFQSKWSDETYSKWRTLQAASDFMPIASDKRTEAAPMTRWLNQRLKTPVVDQPTTTPVKDVFQAKVGADYVYLASEGRYAFTGNLIDLKTGRNLTEENQAKDRLTALEQFPESDMLVFPAEGERKAKLTVFSDPTCPYCRKLHAEVPELQKAGVSVRYIPYPRDGLQGKGYAALSTIWCEKDRRSAMEKAMTGQINQNKAAECSEAKAIEAGYRLGNAIGVRGTPSLILLDGSKVDGYVPSQELIRLLGIRAG